MNYHNNSSNYGNSTYKATIDSIEIIPETYTRDAIILVIFSMIITAINSLIIAAFSINRKLRRRSANVLIFSQACSDLFSGIVFVPTYLIETHYKTSHFVGFFICYMLFLSLFNLLALSTDRYLALSKPFLHYRMIDVRRTVKVIVFIWLTPLALTVIPLTWWFEPMPYKQNANSIYLGVAWVAMFILVVAMTILYSYVTVRARNTIRNKRLSFKDKSHAKMAILARKELRVIHLFGLLLFFFVATYLPILYMNFCDIIGRTEYIPPALQTIGFYLLISNSIVNPILCIYLKKDYLQEITSIIQCKNSQLRRWSARYGSQSETQVEMETSLIRRNSKKQRLI